MVSEADGHLFSQGFIAVWLVVTNRRAVLKLSRLFKFENEIQASVYEDLCMAFQFAVSSNKLHGVKRTVYFSFSNAS